MNNCEMYLCLIAALFDFISVVAFVILLLLSDICLR